MKKAARKLGKWFLWVLGVVAVLGALYISVYFFPYPLFPNHAEFDGFSVYSDREIPDDFSAVIEDARRRITAMELDHAGTSIRIFLCHSQRMFVTLNKLAGKRYVGQALVISAAGNAFFSANGIEEVRRRTGGRPTHSRLEGSWSAAIAHEVAHGLAFSGVGYRRARRIPVWKSEGYADYQANLASSASDPEYDFWSRIQLLLDDDNWRPPVRPFDRRHFRWHLLVEYLSAVRGFGFSDLLDEDVTEARARNEMMEWYSGRPADRRDQ